MRTAVGSVLSLVQILCHSGLVVIVCPFLFREVFVEVSLDNGASFINDNISIISKACVSVGWGFSLPPVLYRFSALKQKTACGGRRGGKGPQEGSVNSLCRQPPWILALN